jgi:hypothetical protein
VIPDRGDVEVLGGKQLKDEGQMRYFGLVGKKSFFFQDSNLRPLSLVVGEE